ncbi:MAG: hypothetical protein LBM93_13665 [Oscillospiraceae bacterium]|jgi:hypothetical protein|nr:hypothetical protein [Oscillospiraceae bacterium]
MNVVFRNVRDCLLTCDVDAEFSGIPIWKQVYHTLHSLDRWFINPEIYTEPSFHKLDLNNMNVKSDGFDLSRDILLKYYEEIKAKIFDYLDSLDDEMLLQIPDKCESDRMTLILAQLRHLFLHIGIINAVTIMNTGKWPFMGGYPKPNDDRIWE